MQQMDGKNFALLNSIFLSISCMILGILGSWDLGAKAISLPKLDGLNLATTSLAHRAAMNFGRTEDPQE